MRQGGHHAWLDQREDDLRWWQDRVHDGMHDGMHDRLHDGMHDRVHDGMHNRVHDRVHDRMDDRGQDRMHEERDVYLRYRWNYWLLL